jgi:hypothetical protein
MNALRLVLERMLAGKSVAMMPTNPSERDVLVAEMIVIAFRQGTLTQTVHAQGVEEWLATTPSAEAAFHLWNALRAAEHPEN